MNYSQSKNILLEKYKSIFFILPKNACTSMKVQLVEILGMEKQAPFPKNVHDPDIYPYPHVALNAINHAYSDYFTFCIVRNPFARLVSCFVDKIREADYNSEEYTNGVAAPLIENSDKFYGGMTFEAFIDVICSIPDSIAEHHFTSQFYQILDNKGDFRVKYIGRLETLSGDLKQISNLSGIPFTHFPHIHKTTRKPYQSYYTQELIEKVSKRFRADLDFFNYSFDQKKIHDDLGIVNQEHKERLADSEYLTDIIGEKNANLLIHQKKVEGLTPEHLQIRQKLEKTHHANSSKNSSLFSKVLAIFGKSIP